MGALGKTIIADIPGLIEGASEGRGLGIQFLKHIKKTKKLVHCIDSSTQDVLTVYQTIRAELKAFDPSLLKKEEILIVTKTDLVSELEVRKMVKTLKRFGKTVLTSSIYDARSLEKLRELLTHGIMSNVD